MLVLRCITWDCTLHIQLSNKPCNDRVKFNHLFAAYQDDDSTVRWDNHLASEQ